MLGLPLSRPWLYGLLITGWLLPGLGAQATNYIDTPANPLLATDSFTIQSNQTYGSPITFQAGAQVSANASITANSTAAAFFQAVAGGAGANTTFMTNNQAVLSSTGILLDVSLLNGQTINWSNSGQLQGNLNLGNNSLVLSPGSQTNALSLSNITGSPGGQLQLTGPALLQATSQMSGFSYLIVQNSNADTCILQPSLPQLLNINLGDLVQVNASSRLSINDGVTISTPIQLNAGTNLSPTNLTVYSSGGAATVLNGLVGAQNSTIVLNGLVTVNNPVQFNGLLQIDGATLTGPTTGGTSSHLSVTGSSSFNQAMSSLNIFSLDNTQGMSLTAVVSSTLQANTIALQASLVNPPSLVKTTLQIGAQGQISGAVSLSSTMSNNQPCLLVNGGQVWGGVTADLNSLINLQAGAITGAVNFSNELIWQSGQINGAITGGASALLSVTGQASVTYPLSTVNQIAIANGGQLTVLATGSSINTISVSDGAVLNLGNVSNPNLGSVTCTLCNLNGTLNLYNSHWTGAISGAASGALNILASMTTSAPITNVATIAVNSSLTPVTWTINSTVGNFSSFNLNSNSSLLLNSGGVLSSSTAPSLIFDSALYTLQGGQNNLVTVLQNNASGLLTGGQQIGQMTVLNSSLTLTGGLVGPIEGDSSSNLYHSSVIVNGPINLSGPINSQGGTLKNLNFVSSNGLAANYTINQSVSNIMNLQIDSLSSVTLASGASFSTLSNPLQLQGSLILAGGVVNAPVTGGPTSQIAVTANNYTLSQSMIVSTFNVQANAHLNLVPGGTIGSALIPTPFNLASSASVNLAGGQINGPVLGTLGSGASITSLVTIQNPYVATNTFTNVQLNVNANCELTNIMSNVLYTVNNASLSFLPGSQAGAAGINLLSGAILNIQNYAMAPFDSSSNQALIANGLANATYFASVVSQGTPFVSATVSDGTGRLNLTQTLSSLPVVQDMQSVQVNSSLIQINQAFQTNALTIQTGAGVLLNGALAAQVLNNQGLVVLNKPVTLTGSYQGSGILSFGITSASNAGQLTVSGDFTPAAGFQIELNLSDYHIIPESASYNLVVLGPSTTTDLTTLGLSITRPTTLPPIYDCVATINPKMITVTLSHLPYLQSVMTPNVARVASFLDTLRSDNYDPPVQALLSLIDNEPSQDARNAAITALTPATHGGLLQSVFRAQVGINNQISNRMESLRLASRQGAYNAGDDFDEIETPPGGFAPLIFQQRIQSPTTANQVGFKARTQGLGLLRDVKLNSNITGGAALSYLQSRIQSLAASPDTSRAQTLQMLLYAHYERPFLSLETQIATQRAQVASLRPIAFLGAQASSHFNAYAYSAYFRMGVPLTKQYVQVMPFIGWRSTRTHQDAYVESGAGLANLSQSAIDNFNWQTSIGGRLSFFIPRAKGQHSLSIQAQIQRDHKAKAQNWVANFNNLSPNFTVQNQNIVVPVAHLISLQGQFFMLDDLSLGLDYEWVRQGLLRSHALYGRLRWSF